MLNFTIMPARARDLFRRNNLWPKRGGWYEGPGPGPCGACILTALAFDLLGQRAATATMAALTREASTPVCAILAHKLRLHPDYALGLEIGWDGELPLGRGESYEKRLGVIHGRRAWQYAEPFGSRT